MISGFAKEADLVRRQCSREVTFGPRKTALGAAGFWRSVLVFGSAAPTTVAVRVLVEGIADPTSHNLWPFEIVIAYGVGLPFAIGGAVVGWLIAWSQKRQ